MLHFDKVESLWARLETIQRLSLTAKIAFSPTHGLLSKKYLAFTSFLVVRETFFWWWLHFIIICKEKRNSECLTFWMNSYWGNHWGLSGEKPHLRINESGIVFDWKRAGVKEGKEAMTILLHSPTIQFRLKRGRKTKFNRIIYCISF